MATLTSSTTRTNINLHSSTLCHHAPSVLSHTVYGSLSLYRGHGKMSHGRWELLCLWSSLSACSFIPLQAEVFVTSNTNVNTKVSWMEGKVRMYGGGTSKSSREIWVGEYPLGFFRGLSDSGVTFLWDRYTLTVSVPCMITLTSSSYQNQPPTHQQRPHVLYH